MQLLCKKVTKKLLSLVLIGAICFILVGCGNSNSNNKDLESNDENTAGGYTKERDITNEDMAIFNEALDGLVGVNYKPLKVSTQVVAGTNYKFYTKATGVYPNAEPYYAYVYIFKPLGEEKATITEIIREK